MVLKPVCFKSNPSYQSQAENDCKNCNVERECLTMKSESEIQQLIMLEAPTGIGKTEAALYLADTWLQSQQGKGIYIAMPTQATSNQMYGRVVDFLKCRYPAQVIIAHLVHSGAIFEEPRLSSPLLGIAQDQQAGEGGVKAETWFLPRKRTLLAPFGVGTVDQAFAQGAVADNQYADHEVAGLPSRKRHTLRPLFLHCNNTVTEARRQPGLDNFFQFIQ